MKRSLAAALLFYLLYPTAVQAEWRYFEESNEVTLSVDFNTSEIQDNHIQYWQLIDLKTESNGIASIAEYIKLNCSVTVKKYQRLQVVAYAKSGGNMPISNEKVVDPVWMFAAPESIYESTFERLCEAVQLSS
jgi:hypothetical protein|tara:strand:- start:183 stop:581 length:399 start_codon:yes stop_codon:yes gene_type:complete